MSAIGAQLSCPTNEAGWSFPLIIWTNKLEAHQPEYAFVSTKTQSQIPSNKVRFILDLGSQIAYAQYCIQNALDWNILERKKNK